MRIFADISKEPYQTEEYLIISICQRTINIIHEAQEGPSLITQQGVVKKKMHICFNIRATRKNWIQSILKTIFEFLLTQMTWTKA